MATSNFVMNPRSLHVTVKNKILQFIPSKQNIFFPLQIKLSAKLFSLKEIPVFKDLSFSSSQNN